MDNTNKDKVEINTCNPDSEMGTNNEKEGLTQKLEEENLDLVMENND